MKPRPTFTRLLTKAVLIGTLLGLWCVSVGLEDRFERQDFRSPASARVADAN